MCTIDAARLPPLTCQRSVGTALRFLEARAQASKDRLGFPNKALFMKRRTLLVSLGAAGVASALPRRTFASQDRATIVFRNGIVYTGRKDGAIAEAAAIGGDRILAVGSRATVDGYVGPATRAIDLKGGMLLPGFIDTHTHFVSGSLMRAQVALDDAESPDDVYKRIAAYARAHPDEAWILGGNWQYDAFAPTGLPTKALLDRAVPDRPAALDAFDGHSLWANSKAMALAGITRATPDPTQNGVAIGTIVRDASGEPTGVFKEGAQQLVRRVIPVPPREKVLSAVRGGLQAANARGVTSVLNASGDLDEMALYATLHSRGELTLRTTTAYSAGAGTRHTLSPEELEAFETARTRYAGDWVRAGVVKFFMDGVVETFTADLLQPYANAPGVRGEPYYPASRYAEMLIELDRRGFAVMTHAVGDGAVRAALDGYQAAIEANGPRDRRWRVEHIEVCDPADVARFAQLGVVASMQPYHFCCPAPDGSDTWERHLGASRWKEGFVWRDILDSGAVMVHGSDWPVVTIDPLIGVYSALAREDPDGNPRGGWFPKQDLPLDAVLAGYTRNAAHVAFMEDRIGTIEAGKLADLVVLDRDLRTVSPQDVLHAQIEHTLVGGKPVYEGGPAPDRAAELPSRPGGECACHRLARPVFAR
jgi:predicted amidohydrolase YtcJ